MPVIQKHLFIYNGLDSHSDQDPHCEIVLWEGYQITSDNNWNQNDDSL